MAKTREEKLYAISDAALNQNFKDEIEDIDILEYADENGRIWEDRFDYIDATTIPITVHFIGGEVNEYFSVPIGRLTKKSVNRLYNMINR